ncbi:MAG: T9SS type A sorting domain-containing protein [Ignavibacteriaceae bacterium]|nr:T9SS type A sorting domain-containing protein [Ignavibacteriaceae bacterium]
MRRILTAFTFLAVFSVGMLAQTGSVELKTGTGTLVNSFASIQLAYNAVPNPIDGAYIIEIKSDYTGANETFPITISVRDSASASKTVTVRPAAGVGMVTVGGTASGQPIFLLSNCDYVIFDGRAGGTGSTINLTVQNLATTSSSFTFRFLDGATYNEIRYVKITNNTMNTAGPRAIEIGTSVSNPTGNSNNLIEYNEIVGGRSGIGFAGTSANPNNNNVVYRNKIYDFAYAGIWVLSSSNNTVMAENQIFQTVGYNTLNFGIISGAGSMDIVSNKIYNIQNTSSTTLRGMQITNTAGSVTNIVNNFVSLPLDNGTKTGYIGILIAGPSEHTSNIYFNTVYLAGIHTGGTAGAVVSAGIQRTQTGATSTFNMKNNILINKRSGGSGLHTSFYVASANMVGTMSVDYNVYYGFDAASQHAGWNGVLYSSVNDYRTAAAPNEQNTIFKQPLFVDSVDLHLTGASVGDVELAGLTIDGITTDIDGQPRSSDYPYRGADEGNIPIPVELTSFSATVSGTSVNLNWSTATEVNTKSFEIERKSTGEWNKVGSVSASGNSTEIRNYVFTDAGLSAGKYSYRLRIVDFDGTFKYSPAAEVNVGMPMEFSLSQNYPNPFNPSTVISFQLPVSGKVSLKVYDVTGKEVSTLVNEVKEAGYHSVKFDASDLTSGMYVYELKSGNFVQSKKLLLVK